ncbi:hypothetical protein GOBAR_DD00962 [Gossypium barbadense]|nr:hypothetical protein GOBAR_DD00962 [Gossypium barbadense]
MTDSRLSTCGGVMRDHAVKWLAGFARKVGTSTDSNAELWGAYDGLKMAWAVGAQQVILKMESMAAINSDGVRMTDSRLSTCGGVMRDHAVKWLAGFARKVGTSTDSNAELWGAYDGLKMAWAVGAQQVILKMESMAAVKLIG